MSRDFPPTSSPALVNEQPTAPQGVKPGDAYCSHCGYVLTGLRDAARCPECGRPLVEVLTRVPFQQMGRSIRYRSSATLFGVPVIDLAFGPRPEAGERHGVAKGIIAGGDVAYGGIAFGGMSIGVVSAGGMGIGVSALGGAAIGLLNAMGGLAIGGFATGGGAVGAIASGGGAAGIIAQGGGAIGVYARGGGVKGTHTITPRKADPEAVKMFQAVSPLLGGGPGPSPLTMGRAFLSNAAISAALALIIGMVAFAAIARQRRFRHEAAILHGNTTR